MTYIPFMLYDGWARDRLMGSSTFTDYMLASFGEKLNIIYPIVHLQIHWPIIRNRGCAHPTASSLNFGVWLPRRDLY